MRVSVLAVLVSCLFIADHVAAHHRTDTCWADNECGKNTGQYCFCLKTHELLHGHCICQVDPDLWKPQPVPSCYQDENCEHLAYGAQSCFCDKQQYGYYGECKCVNAVL